MRDNGGLEDGGEGAVMYHGVDRRKLTDRRKVERRKFDPVAAQAHEEGVGRGELVDRRKGKDRRRRERRQDNAIGMELET